MEIHVSIQRFIIAMRYFVIILFATALFQPCEVKAEICQMGKNAYSEQTIVCECPQLIKKDENTYDIVSRRLVCGKDGVQWNVVTDGGSPNCFNITDLALTTQLNNLTRLSQSMAGCSP